MADFIAIQTFMTFFLSLEKPQKKFFFSGPLRGGGVGKGRETEEKELFWSSKKNPKINVANKHKGEGGSKALVAGPLKNILEKL